MDHLIDSSVLIELERGVASPELTALVSGGGSAISVVTVSELLHGVHRASVELRARRRSIVERMLGIFQPLPIDTDVARVHSEIWAQLDASGRPINSHDMWIAATALVHDLTVLTLDTRDFARVPGLQVATG
jgi:tRNA(fMet)-specific endonuclease VapC